jgi:hypothetical protein
MTNDLGWSGTTNYTWSAPPAVLAPNAIYNFTMETKVTDYGGNCISISGMSSPGLASGWQSAGANEGPHVFEYTAPAAPATATEERVIVVDLSSGAVSAESENYVDYWYVYEWRN